MISFQIFFLCYKKFFLCYKKFFLCYKKFFLCYKIFFFATRSFFLCYKKFFFDSPLQQVPFFLFSHLASHTLPVLMQVLTVFLFCYIRIFHMLHIDNLLKNKLKKIRVNKLISVFFIIFYLRLYYKYSFILLNNDLQNQNILLLLI